MRAAVVYFGEKNTGHLKAVSEKLAAGIEKHGHSVDIINAKDFNRRIAIYQLVALGTEVSGTFGGGIPEGIDKFLRSAGPVINLRSYAFVAKKGLRCEKSLQALMRVMESEGMFLVCSDVLGSDDDIAAAADMLVSG